MNVQCCFCAGPVETAQSGVRIVLESMESQDVHQQLFAHISCLDQRFVPILAPSTPFMALAFGPD